MSDQIQDQISAFIDDELSAEECSFLVRRMERDAKSRDKVLRYSIIGAALRGELPNPDPDVLRERVRAALDGVGSVEQPAETPPRTKRFFRPAIGLGIAASVAVAAAGAAHCQEQPDRRNRCRTADCKHANGYWAGRATQLRRAPGKPPVPCHRSRSA